MSYYQQIYERRWEQIELRRVAEVWKVLVHDYFQKLVRPDSRVLDIGCGFCHFLNNIQAKEKVGVDANVDVLKYANPDVTVHITDNLELPDLPEDHFDYIFMSNFLEHLPSGDSVINLLHRCRELLAPGGQVIILQPNIRLTGPAYFDFIDHKVFLTERSVEEALNVASLRLVKEVTRFLPYTTKSSIPKHPALVRLYLAFPPIWYFMGKQSLFVAEKSSDDRGAA